MVCTAAVSHRMFLNVGYDLTEKQVRTFFNTFGHVTDVYLPRQANGRNKGFGFATFSDAEALQAALKTAAHRIEGFTVQVKRAGPRPSEMVTKRQTPAVPEQKPPRGSCRLLVTGVADTTSVSDVTRHFEAWGRVKNIAFCGRDSQKCTQDYSVVYDSASSAEQAHDQSPRQIGGWPLAGISLSNCKAESPKTSLVQAATQAPSKPAVHPMTNLLQSQAAAAGCCNPYAAWLQAHSQLLADGAAAKHAAVVSAKSSAPSALSSSRPASIQPNPLNGAHYQTSFNSVSEFAQIATADHQLSLCSYPSISGAIAHNQGLSANPSQELEPFLHRMNSDYSSELSQNVSPVSSASRFLAWSNSSVSSDSGNFVFTDSSEFRPSAADRSALELQDHLRSLCQTANGKMQDYSAAAGAHFEAYAGANQQGNYAVGSY